MTGDGVHVRLMVTRGPKSTPYQDPRMSAGPATVVIIAEYKDPLPSTAERGLSLFTVHVRRAAPDTLDPKLNAHSKLNDITACIQAYTAGADEALMLDPHGFVATCNSTHFFIVRKGEVWTSTGDYCLGGITRSNVLQFCAARHPGARAQLQPHPGLQRRRGVRDRHVRRAGARAHRRRAPHRHRRARARGPTAPVAVSRPGARRRRRTPRAVTAGVRLAVWSGPRNISTALMRSWENRPDCRVVDEPLYAYYLAETGLNHPGRDEVIAAGETSWHAVVAELTAPVDGIYYQKHMTHHLIPQLPRDWIGALTNVLLIRDPAEVVASYVRSRADVVAEDIGLVQQAELYDQLGGTPPVIDAADFLRDPEGYLRWLCRLHRRRLHRGDAALAGRAAGVRRRVGAVLVRRGPRLHRLRALPAARSRTARRRPGRQPSGAGRTTSGCTPCGSCSDRTQTSSRPLYAVPTVLIDRTDRRWFHGRLG